MHAKLKAIIPTKQNFRFNSAMTSCFVLKSNLIMKSVQFFFLRSGWRNNTYWIINMKAALELQNCYYTSYRKATYEPIKFKSIALRWK